MAASVEALFVAVRGSEPMLRVDRVTALAGRGLDGDRYCERSGYWTGVDECQVTLISAEDLDAITRDSGVAVGEGQHRRNIVVRGMIGAGSVEGAGLQALAGQRFRLGSALFEYDRPRPPCAYIDALTEPGMTRSLLGRGGICVRVIEDGSVGEGDEIVVVEPRG